MGGVFIPIWGHGRVSAPFKPHNNIMRGMGVDAGIAVHDSTCRLR